VYKLLLKPLFFLLSPEGAHHLALIFLKLMLALPGMNTIFRWASLARHPALRRECLGLVFENPVGLAAGFDKDGNHFKAMAALGFGFVEIGTVTPRPQAGNPRPRLFRLPKDEALINRMGFNNEGVEALVARLKQGKPRGLIVGGNIGKNKDTPNEQAVEDYACCFEALYPYVDYFVVNVSSPNTPNLRELQDKEPLSKLLAHLQSLNQKKQLPRPILLKIAPDLSNQQLDDILDIVRATQIDGVIASNTTISREGLKESPSQVAAIGPGGLSGQPLKQRATEVISYLYEKSGKELFIIGVGGIASPQDALEKLAAGAALIQIYTGLIYEGPGLIRRINEALAAKADR
jgi:dihydroorotate dehydrogenase